METKKTTALQRLGILLAWVIGFVVAGSLGRALVSGLGGHSSGHVNGLIISRDNYTANCVGAVDADTIAKLGRPKATTYCQCTYDTGVARYGGEKYTQMSAAAEKSSTLSPEINQIVNDCAFNLR